MMHFRLRLRAVAATLALTAVGCGDSPGTTPPPEVVETAESVATPISFTAQISTTPTADDAEKDPITLDGRVFGDGSTGVILTHMRPADQTEWFPFATELAETGEYTVLTFDFRGYGASTGDKQFDRIDTDLAAAIEYMRAELPVEDVFIVGASMGGTAALVVGSRIDVAGIVTISAPGQFPPLDALDHIGEIDAPKLFVTSEDDVPQARAQEEFWEIAPEPKQRHVYDGDAHGTALFDGPHAADLKRRIIGFLRAH